eukprot:3382463-Rhodomonas_salina.2
MCWRGVCAASSTARTFRTARQPPSRSRGRAHMSEHWELSGKHEGAGSGVELSGVEWSGVELRSRGRGR